VPDEEICAACRRIMSRRENRRERKEKIQDIKRK
jgi:hypothetical protein